MSKVKQAFLSLFSRFKNGLERFYTATIFSLTLFASSAYMIIANKVPDSLANILNRITLTTLLGLFLSVALILIKERYFFQTNKKLLNIVGSILNFIIPILYGLFIFTDSKNKYQMASLLGFCVALVCIIIYFSNKHANNKFSEHWAHIFSKGCTAAVISFVFMLGLFLCTAAVDFLIYKLTDAYKIYTTISAFIWYVFFSQLFLSYFPTTKESYSETTFFKKITIYAALPVFTALLVILYIYLGKILITFKFPSGQLNWFASCASLVGLFLYLGISQYCNTIRLVKYYVRFFGIAILPIIAMQLWAYLIRFNSYGLTSTRYILLVLIIASIIAAILTIIQKGKHLPVILLICSVLAIISTSGYLNLYDVSYFEQNSRLTTILQKNKMLDANKNIIPNANIAIEEKQKITSAFAYFTESEMEKSELLKPYTDSNFEKIFGFKKEHEKDENYYIYKYICFESDKKQYNIEKYSQLIIIDSERTDGTQFVVKEGVITVTPEWPTGKTYVFDLSKILQTENDENIQVEKTNLTFEVDDSSLILDRISVKLNKDGTRELINFNGVFVIK